MLTSSADVHDRRQHVVGFGGLMEDTDSFGWTPLHFVSGFNLPGLLGVHLGWRVANRTRVSTHFSKVCVCVHTFIS